MGLKNEPEYILFTYRMLKNKFRLEIDIKRNKKGLLPIWNDIADLKIESYP